MEKGPIRGQITLAHGQPMQLSPADSGEAYEPTAEQWEIVRPVAQAIKAYLHAAEALLSGTYAGLRQLAPPHLAHPGRAAVIGTDDGVLIRYERPADEA